MKGSLPEVQPKARRKENNRHDAKKRFRSRHGKPEFHLYDLGVLAVKIFSLGFSSVPLSLILSTCFLLAAQAGEHELPKVTHYGLNVKFLLTEHRVHVDAALTIQNVTQSSPQEIPFLLYRLLSVQRITDALGNPLKFEQSIVQLSDESSLQARFIVVNLPKALPPNDSLKIIITYEGFIFGYPEVMAYVRDRIDETYSLFRPDAFAYPMLARASHSSSLAAYDTKFTYEIAATVPKGYTAVCGGDLSNSSRLGPDSATFVFHSKVPTWRIDLAAAKFTKLADSPNKLFVYHLPDDSSGAKRVLEASKKVLNFYGVMFGRPKHYQGYTVIEIPDGWGSQAGDFYFLQTAAAFKDSSRIGEVYHEIGHSWNATPSPSVKRCRYFDEAFASFFESLAIRSFEGEQRFEADMEKSRTLFVQWANYDRKVFDTPIAEYGNKELGRHSYTKGSWSLYVLNQIVGDEMFARIVRTMLAEFESKTIDFTGFQKLCERISKRNLKKYFDEWIYGIESSKLLVGGVAITEIVKRY